MITKLIYINFVKEYTILKFKDVINISINKYMFRIYTNNYFKNQFINYLLIIAPIILFRKIYLDHEKFCIRYKGAYLCNSLNETISSLTNLNTFTMHIKNMFLNNYILSLTTCVSVLFVLLFILSSLLPFSSFKVFVSYRYF